MISILIAIIACGVLGMVLTAYTADRYSMGSLVGGFVGVVTLLGAALSSLVYAFVAWEWFASEYKAKIINNEYGTHYTREEVFWASDVIDTVRELDRKRIEVNGDLMRDEADK